MDSLIHKHILLICLLLIEASIHLPIELMTLPIASCMLLHKLRIHHELRMVDHGHVLLLATILVTQIEHVCILHLLGLVLLIVGPWLSDIHRLWHDIGLVMAQMLLLLHGLMVVHLLVVKVLIHWHSVVLMARVVLMIAWSDLLLPMSV